MENFIRLIIPYKIKDIVRKGRRDPEAASSFRFTPSLFQEGSITDIIIL
jgi:hypothetical protein